MVKKKFECPEGSFCFDGDVSDAWLASTANRHFSAYESVCFDPTDIDVEQQSFSLYLALRAVRPLNKPTRKAPPSIKGIFYAPKSYSENETILELFDFVGFEGNLAKFESK